MTGWKIPARGEKFRRSGGLEIYDDKICTKVSDINARDAASANKMCESYTLDDVYVSRRYPPLHGAEQRGEGRGGAGRGAAVTLCGFPLMCNIRSQPYAAVSAVSCARCVLNGIATSRDCVRLSSAERFESCLTKTRSFSFRSRSLRTHPSG